MDSVLLTSAAAPMRILYMINSVDYGGAERQLHERAVALVRRGHTVGVISMMPFVHFEDSLKAAGVQTFTLGLRGRDTVARAALAYVRVVRGFRPDLVHAHLFWSAMFARLMRLACPAFGLRTPVLVCSSHSRAESSHGRYVAYRLTNALGDVWASVSREGIAVHEEARAIPVGSAKWMPNGIDLTRYALRPGAREEVRAELGVGPSFLWLALGSFHADSKDYATLLRAFARVPGASRLFIGGEGELLEARRALATSLGLGERVRFLGLRSDVERLLQAADAYVMSSQTEGMPNVLLQAAASCLPIVTTNVGEASAIVEDGRGGYVVEKKNLERLADAMIRMETLSEEGRRRFGEAARAHVAEHFAFERVVDRWEALYRDAVAAKG